MNNEIKIALYKESFLQSIIADFVTYTLLVSSFGFNHLYIGSGFLNGVLLIIMVITVCSWSSVKQKTLYSPDDLIEFANTLKESNGSKT